MIKEPTYLISRHFVSLLVVFFASHALAKDMPLVTVGQGDIKFLFKTIYVAELMAEDSNFEFPIQTPFVLKICYKINLKAEKIVNETYKQWREQGITVSSNWQVWVEELIPDVKKNDCLALTVEQTDKAHLSLNDSLLGSTTEQALIEAFAGIWLSPKSTRPELRAALLGEK
jgi:hypothetical protein